MRSAKTTETTMKLNYPREWFEQRIEREENVEIGAGIPAAPRPVEYAAGTKIRLADTRIAFGQFVGLWRRNKGWNAERLASAAGIAPQEILEIECDPYCEPEPDAVVLAVPFHELAARAAPDHIRLVVEVTASTLRFDLTTKAGLYARALIAEYWVLDINSRRIIVHRDPAQGKYSSIVAYGEEEFLSPLAAPSAQVRVGDLL